MSKIILAKNVLMTRIEHLEWCKNRALDYCNVGDINNAWKSMISDLAEHEENSNHPGILLGIMLIFAGKLSTEDEMRKFIEEFK